MPNLPNSMRSSRFWIILLVLLALNWFLVPLLFPDTTNRIEIPYTLFKQQVAAGNVVEITGQGEDIQGTFKQAVADPDPPTGQQAQTSTAFSTHVPTFAQVWISSPSDGPSDPALARSTTLMTVLRLVATIRQRPSGWR